MKPSEMPLGASDDPLWQADDGTSTSCDHNASGVGLMDFYAFMPAHSYIFAPAREMWPASSVNAKIPPIPVTDANGNPKLDDKGKAIMQPANAWLDRNRSVEQMTWSPGDPIVVRDRLISEGGWIERKKVATFNLYRPPTVILPQTFDAGPWLNHLESVYPDDAIHIVKWLAHRVQRPHDKINHALVLGGAPGVGKDTILEPVKQAIGPWNFAEASPKQVLGRFNGFIKSVILRVSEARDLGDVDRFAFYDAMKTLTAAPPDVLRCDEKYLKEHSVFNVTGVILTTNYKSDGIYLPADDRRHYVAWSNADRKDFAADYWTDLYGWFASGGDRAVAAYLHSVNLSRFDAKAPPPKTPAFWEIVAANHAPEDAELADALDALKNPDATTLEHIALKAIGSFAEYLRDTKNRRKIPHRMEKVGYVPVRNEAAKDGLWKLGDRRQTIYAKKELPIRDRIEAAERLLG